MAVGFVVSITKTSNWHEPVPLVLQLEAITVTYVVPTLNADPLPVPLPVAFVAPEKLYVYVGEGTLVAVTVYVSALEHVLELRVTIWLPGHSVN